MKVGWRGDVKDDLLEASTEVMADVLIEGRVGLIQDSGIHSWNSQD